MRGRNVLVAGGTGLIGASLTRRLDALGARVLASCHERPPPFLAERYRRFDFTELADCLEATRGMDDVFLCAAQSFGAQVMHERPESLVLPNLRINAGLLEACRRNAVARVLFISSSTVYQEALHPIREDELDLNCPPYSLYAGVGWVNRYLEQLARFYFARHGLGVAIVRPTNVYGPFDNFDDGRSHVLPALIKRALAREDPFVVWGNGHALRDFLYVDDLVDDLIAALERHSIAEPLNLASGRGVTIREAVSVVLEVCDHAVAPQYDESRPDAIPYRMLDTTRADAILGPRQRTSLRSGIEKTVRWYHTARAA
jgi:GDP-L-fucose synthase